MNLSFKLNFGSGNRLRALLQYLASGFPTALVTGSGSPMVADYAGVLRKANTPSPAIEGGRLATTVADGAELGPELAVNGGFDSDTAWTKGTGVTISGGAATIASSGAGNALQQSTTTGVAGKVYQCTYTVSAYSGSGSIRVQFGSAMGTFRSSNGTFTENVTATGTGSLVLSVGGTAFNGVVDNVSIKEVIPKWYDTLTDGTPLQPFRMTRTKSGGSVKEYLDYPDRQNTATYALGAKVTAIASDGIRRWYEATASGITAGSQPSMPTSGTVVDGGVTWQYMGYATLNHRRYLGLPAATNKVTARKVNPTDFTNITTSGPGTFSIVSQTVALNNGGLSSICTSGNVYKIDATGGAISEVVFAPTVGNTNIHSSAVYVWGTGNVVFRINATGATFALTSVPTRITEVNITPSSSTRQLRLIVEAGSTAYFILPELIEAPFLTQSPVVPGPAETDALSSYTRPATICRENSEGRIRSQNTGFWLRVNPSAAGQSSADMFGTYVDGSNYLQLRADATQLLFNKRLGTSNTASPTYTHAANTPFEARGAWTDQGMLIQTRALNGADWSNWSLWATNTNTAPAPIASTFEIGSRNGANQFAGNYGQLKTLFLPTLASLDDYKLHLETESNWGM